jgi:RNA polymerase sigma factor (sigma-70 family)
MMPSPSSDGELVARSLRGESEAFGDLYNRYFPAVYDFLHRTMRNSEEAADVTQETFLRAMESLGSLANPAAFKSWLFSIAHHQALNRLERQKRFVMPPASDGDDAEIDPLLCQVDTDRLANPEQAAEMQETARLVWEAAASLDKRTYAVLDLHARQGLESAEIAEVLGVSKGNAYTMLNRMKRSLEEAIGVYLLMRRGSKKCDVLQGIVAPFAIPPVTMEMRKTVERHVRKCDVCTETRRTLMAPLAVFGAFAAVPAPAGLRERIWGDLSLQWAQMGPPSYGTGVGPKTAKTEPTGRGGGIREGGLSASPWGGRRFALVLGAVLVVALVPLFLVMSSVSLPGNNTVGPAERTATATRRATPTRIPTKKPSATVVKTATTTPLPAATAAHAAPSATPPPVATTPTRRPTTAPSVQPTGGPRPTLTPEPTRTRFPTHTPRPTRTPEPTIPFLQ